GGSGPGGETDEGVLLSEQRRDVDDTAEQGVDRSDAGLVGADLERGPVVVDPRGPPVAVVPPWAHGDGWHRVPVAIQVDAEVVRARIGRAVVEEVELDAEAGSDARVPEAGAGPADARAHRLHDEHEAVGTRLTLAIADAAGVRDAKR